MGRFHERADRRRRDETSERLEALGEPTLGGDFVGIGYSDKCWTYGDLGRSLDEGILRLDLDRLTFVGRDTRFDLPAEAILGTEIRRYESGVGKRMSLYVHWVHGGEAGTLSLELPFRRTLRRRVEEIADLQVRIERWRNEPFPHRTVPSLLPPRLELSERPDPDSQVSSTARLFAGGVCLTGFLLLTVGGDLGLTWAGYPQLGHKLGSSSGAFCGCGWLLWTELAAKIEARLPERYRYQAKEEKTVRDALRTAEGTQRAESESNASLNH